MSDAPPGAAEDFVTRGTASATTLVLAVGAALGAISVDTAPAATGVATPRPSECCCAIASFTKSGTDASSPSWPIKDKWVSEVSARGPAELNSVVRWGVLARNGEAVLECDSKAPRDLGSGLVRMDDRRPSSVLKLDRDALPPRRSRDDGRSSVGGASLMARGNRV